MVADPKVLSFYLSINVIFNTLSFVVLDLYSVILFQKLGNTLYIHVGVSISLFVYMDVCE